MRTSLLTVAAGLLGLSAVAFAVPTAPVNLLPAAAEVQWGEPMSTDGPGAILLAKDAAPAERKAAELLARYVKRRFGWDWSIHTAADVPAAAKLRVYVGQRQTFPELDALCKAQGLNVPEQPEAYALKTWTQDGKVLAAVAGARPRSAFYGLDTLFQLLKRQSDRMVLQGATIRDWPGIPLRGRPHPHYQYFFKSENFDCMMSSRVNFIDLRDGIYAFEPGAKVNREEIRKVIQDARDRDLRVYAVVNCGVPKADQDAVMAVFKEFLDLGADALWASFDDKGSGEAPREMVNRVIALGRERGITGEGIAITPPKGDYQTIQTPFNREIAAVPGMELAAWYWTCIPDPQGTKDGKAIGLKVRPSWWHNWPRLSHGSLHSGGGSYTPVLDLAHGWNHPTDKELREMGSNVHAVLPWDGWQAQQHYLVPVIGWWSWRPEQYDREAQRVRIYDMVFGPDQVQTAAAFDDGLNAVQEYFQFWTTHTDYAPHCPPRLRLPSDRSRVQAQLEILQSKLAGLRKGAIASSLLDGDLLRKEYLDTMTREVETGLAAAQAPYPEYSWQPHQDALLKAVYAGDTAKADQLIAGVRERVLKDVAEVERLLKLPGKQSPYVNWWRARVDMTAAEWKTLLEKRQAELKERVAEYDRTVAPTAQMLSGVNDPPVQVGTGVWVAHNHLLATVNPQPHETFWGDWIGGLYQHGDMQVTAFALAKHLAVNGGVFSELPVNVPLSGQRDRLALLVYLADANKESFGLGRSKWRWAGYRTIRLFWGERELWNADLGIPRLTGEWFVVRLPALPADLGTLPLRLRIEDYYNAKNSLEIVYVGPIHLLELDPRKP